MLRRKAIKFFGFAYPKLNHTAHMSIIFIKLCDIPFQKEADCSYKIHSPASLLLSCLCPTLGSCIQTVTLHTHRDDEHVLLVYLDKNSKRSDTARHKNHKQ